MFYKSGRLCTWGRKQKTTNKVKDFLVCSSSAFFILYSGEIKKKNTYTSFTKPYRSLKNAFLKT